MDLASISLKHFTRAAIDIGRNGDNDTLPFDIDTKFTKEKAIQLAKIAYSFFDQLRKDSIENNATKIKSMSVFNERMLAPTGSTGFRVSTKIHPFWTIYFNGLGVAIAEALEPKRCTNVYSYRFTSDETGGLFDRTSSWRAFRQCTFENLESENSDTMVVQTDISSFYDGLSHHHLQNFINDLFDGDQKIGNQIIALLSRFSGGRSFGLPIGGQCSRILAELFLNQVDQQLTDSGLKWSRYVDDYTIICESNAEAYKALCSLSHELSNYGLTLNKSKTIILTARHHSDYVKSQLGSEDNESGKLKEIDLYFDPYSDAPIENYDSLKHTVESLQVQKLLNREIEKSLPDNFLVSQIARTLQLQQPETAAQIVKTLLNGRNLNSFRASWSTIMRGIANLRSAEILPKLASIIDTLLDQLPEHSSHLLQSETNLLHYLRAIRSEATPARLSFVHRTYDSTRSDTVARACINCWREWKHRPAFTKLINRWSVLSPECQRVLWLMSYSMGDQGDGFRRSHKSDIEGAWSLGIEKQGKDSYSSIYRNWCDAQYSSK